MVDLRITRSDFRGHYALQRARIRCSPCGKLEYG
jgi:hypothetical protein